MEERPMAKDPGHVPDAAELALLSAAQLVVTEANARLDDGDIDGALDLYADDAVLEAAGGRAARGRGAIRQSIMRNAAAGAGRLALHVVSNVRAFTDDGAVVIDCTQIAYLLESPRPYAPQSIHNVRYVLKPSSAGNLRIVEQRVPDYELK